MMGDQSLHYMTTDELKALADDNTLGIDVTRDERGTDSTLIAPLTAEEDHLTPQHVAHQEATFSSSIATDNVDLARAPVHAGFLVSFMVDARGGAMRGCRHSGVRVIIPPRKAPMPMRITCRYLRKEKLAYPPPLMEGEACASRILEVGPSGAKFLGPVIIEVPHFASLRGREREITILRSDNGESWREHTLEASDDAVHDVFNESFEGEELTAIEDLSTNRITRILTTDFPQYFAIITRIRQEVHAIGPEGGMVSSTVVPQVQAIFPEGALTKKIKVGLQAQPITPELVTKLLGNRVAVSPIVTVEPRRRKFHKPITLTIPVPQAATKGMINQYSGDAPTLRLLCSITGGTTKAQWEDVTGSTPLTFVNDCVSFTTTVSARFWLMDCRQVNEATKFATELYREAIHVPFMAKFVVFAKRHDPLEAQLRVFCMTDDKEDKTLESQEHFTEVAKSRDVEVLEGKPQYLEFAGNLVPVTKSGEQLSLTFQAFRENRLPFTIRVKDPHQEPMGRVAFMREPRVGRGEPPQLPICNLNIVLPEADLTPVSELVTLEKKYGFVQETSLAKPELIHRADLRLSDIAKELKDDWVLLALQLDLPESDINSIRSENPNDTTQQALVMLRHWLQRAGSKATGNFLEKGLRKINREDIVNQCMFNVELVTDDVEKAVAKVRLDQSGFDTFKEELGSSRDASLRRETSLNGTYDEQDIMKDAESAAETSSESSDKEAHYRSEGRHPETRTEGVTGDNVSQKGFEEGPETLVQNVPTALAESFTQPISNGQMSDTSIHEEDKSEPTVATLSSEATAEMEVSSLEDKSQTETHVEKRAQTSNVGATKYRNGLQPTLSTEIYKIAFKDTPRNVKLYNQLKRNTYSEMTRKKVTFDHFPRTMTPPVTLRKKKLITRRNSWPPDSPLKFNRRKKYQLRLKVKDLQEPFWTNTYEWLTMKFAPENLRLAPLASLSEFEGPDDAIKLKYSLIPNVKDSKLHDKGKYFSRNYLSTLKSTDIITLYFVKKASKKLNSRDEKKYLQNLKNRCLFDSIKYLSVCSVKPTDFTSIPPNVDNLLSDAVANNISNAPNYNCAPVSFSDAFVAVDHILSNEHNENPLLTETIFQDPFRSLPQTTTRSSLRPLQSYNNSDTFSDVLILNTPTNVENQFHVKQKMIGRGILRNKENIIGVSSIGFPNAVFPENIKRPITSVSPSVSGQVHKRGHKAFSTVSKSPFSDQKYSTNFGKEANLFSKTMPRKNNQNDITSYSPEDMPDPNATDSKKDGSSKEKPSSTPSTSSKVQTSKVSDYQSEQQSSPESSASGQSQSNKPYLRQLFEQDIQSNFSRSSRKNKEDQEKKSSEESDISKMTEKGKSSKKEIKETDDALSKVEASSLQPTDISQKTVTASVVGQSYLKSLEERVEAEGNVSGAQFPASVIGHAFLNALVEQQNKFSENTSSTSEAIPASVIGQSFLKTLVQQQACQDYPKEQPIPAAVIGQTFLKNLVSSQDQPEVLDSTKTDSTISLNVGSSQDPQLESQCIPASVVGQAFLKSLVESQSDAVSDVSKPIIPASVIGQSFLKELKEQHSDNIPSKPHIPAPAISQSFLRTLIESSNLDSTQEECKEAIPASVISQSFLKSLLNQQSSSQEIEAKTVPASVVGQAFLKTLIESKMSPETSDAHSSKPVPAPVVSQSFLKTLLEQSSFGDDSSKKEQLIPASVVGQTFLKSLIECQSAGSDEETAASTPIPSAVIGQAFIKSLIDDESKTKEIEKQSASYETQLFQEGKSSDVIPAAVIEQSFLKALIQEQTTQESKDEPIPASVVGQVFLKTLAQTKSESIHGEKSAPIPASVLGQTFLKSLIAEQPEFSQSVEEKPLPASVVGQTFLKTLIEQGKTSDVVSEEKTIPSAVVGQAFLKTLVEQGKSSETKLDEMPVPSTVVGQTFLKTLVEQGKSLESKVDQQPIPSSVVGQAFLKTLVEQVETPEHKSEAVTIPSAVIGQAFLKTLVEQGKTPENKSEVAPIPSAVVGQAFLKTLVEQNKTSVIKTGETPIPSAVVDQVFLKTLIEKGKTSECKADEKLIPSSVAGQAFLKTLVEQGKSSETKFEEKPIPSAVVSQSFLKTLIEQEKASEGKYEFPVSSSAVGQAFLKTLVKQHKPSESKCDEKAIPSSVVGQAFLKTLVEQGKSSESDEKPIPSSVIGQTFLKSLIEEKGEDIETVKTIPSSVVGQAFLKTLLDQASPTFSSDHSHKEEPPQTFEKTQTVRKELLPGKETIPASVVGQTFLSSLLTQTQSPEILPKKEPIPASVIGLAFLKTLTGQAESDADLMKHDVDVSSTVGKVSSEIHRAIPANVVGQAFLKTLMDVTSESVGKPQDSPTTSKIPQNSNVEANNGFHDGCSYQGNLFIGAPQIDDPLNAALQKQSPLSEELCPIIPPPPEFSSTSESTEISSSSVPQAVTGPISSNIEVTSGIIGELLSYTKVMQSVIEGMKESEIQQQDPTVTDGSCKTSTQMTSCPEASKKH